VDLRTALTALRRGWIFPVVGMLAAGTVTAGLQQTRQPSYATAGTYLVAFAFYALAFTGG